VLVAGAAVVPPHARPRSAAPWSIHEAALLSRDDSCVGWGSSFDTLRTSGARHVHAPLRVLVALRATTRHHTRAEARKGGQLGIGEGRAALDKTVNTRARL
jgi:hypothetical protein